MSEGAQSTRQFGQGPLAGPAAFIYTLLVVELMAVVASLPGLVPLALLNRDASNLPLAAVCAIPFGPALSAALYALHHRSADLADLSPVAAFWRGYRANARDVLWIWVPMLVWLTIVAINLSNFAFAAVPRWWGVVLVVLAVLVTLWAANALVIASLFAFRARDVARLAVYFLGNTFSVTIGNVCLLIVAVAVTLVLSEVVLALLAVVFLLALLRNSRPMIAKVRDEFVA
jgi:hypothetical protein